MDETRDDPYAATDTRYAYTSPLVDRLREHGFRLTAGRVTVVLPAKFGFCWGVDRALAMVNDAIARNQGRRIWLVDQEIHNPRVNGDLLLRGIRFLKGPLADAAGFDGVRREDLVLIPAFSAEVEDRRRISEAGSEIVDTTCPWVMKPHKRTEKYAREGFTTVIHGMARHEETRATCSLIAHAGGHYVVVQALEDTEVLAAVLGEPGDPGPFRAAFRERLSPGFDPARHLERVGMVNQTTMLASESREVAARVRAAMARRYGEAALAERFRDFDTICRATQENQDALAEAVAAADPDLLLVVGGYDSSNTKNLARIGDARGIPTYHLESPASIEAHRIRHRDRRSGLEVETGDWLPAGEITVAFAAGASTPDTLLAEAIERIFEAAGVHAQTPLAAP
ncbi:MAG: 4-hydroxy-3-methylbut-2-enyl diphosphate reductase [Planctomycetes bacterium]|nr:4-hydroxy-3-methylbut-2-enyl diphosphate reductase [Planctomycetota bacterium]